jgi:hypothetical protein
MSKSIFPIDELTEEMFVENEELFFLLIHNTFINKMTGFGIPRLPISPVMNQVFGS